MEVRQVWDCISPADRGTLGGTIGCENLPQKGSRFWFRLPQTPAAPSLPSLPQKGKVKARMNQAKSLPPRKSPARVLLADDQSEIRMLTADQLQRNGHHVVAVANGQEALAALQREVFDVALLDEDMPMMTGPEVLKAIREKSTTLRANDGLSRSRDTTVTRIANASCNWASMPSSASPSARFSRRVVTRNGFACIVVS